MLILDKYIIISEVCDIFRLVTSVILSQAVFLCIIYAFLFLQVFAGIFYFFMLQQLPTFAPVEGRDSTKQAEMLNH